MADPGLLSFLAFRASTLSIHVHVGFALATFTIFLALRSSRIAVPLLPAIALFTGAAVVRQSGPSPNEPIDIAVDEAVIASAVRRPKGFELTCRFDMRTGYLGTELMSTGKRGFGRLTQLCGVPRRDAHIGQKDAVKARVVLSTESVASMLLRESRFEEFVLEEFWWPSESRRRASLKCSRLVFA
ncbi:hypothetical protein BDV93DRAFT_512128 [Ceratobasidium sp. AG-I]|nr:hypothetical protein BDV93DRAFT_512128 [Ceratobasidium sp. AG-I]